MSKKKKSTWNNRITGHGSENPNDLAAHDLNWRTHPDEQKAVVGELLDGVGWVDEVMVNLRTGDEWPKGERNVKTVVDGHLRRGKAIAEGIDEIPVKYVDLSPEEEALVLATLDSSTGMAGIDIDNLEALLDGIGKTGKATTTLLDDLKQEAFDLRDEDGLLDIGGDGGDNGETSSMMKYLRFGEWDVPMTTEEEEALNERAQDYFDENGAVYGFVAEVLDVSP